MIAVLLQLALTATPIDLPGAHPISIDYIAYDPVHHRVWVPAGSTGNVDVFDVRTTTLSSIPSFPTAPSTRAGRPPMGPSSVAVAGDVVWVGNRADKRLSAFDAVMKGPLGSVTLGAMPDGLAFVAVTSELWITTPSTSAIAIVDTKKKAVTGQIAIDGSPEGFVVDGERFYTNVEDRDRTLAIDVKSRKVVATYAPGCGPEGPRGLQIDARRRLLFVACTNGVVTLDLAHDGKVLGRLTTGAGVDDLSYLPSRQQLYVASGKDGKLTIVRADDRGQLSVVGSVGTAEGARNAAVDETGAAYVVDGRNGRLFVVKSK